MRKSSNSEVSQVAENQIMYSLENPKDFWLLTKVKTKF